MQQRGGVINLEQAARFRLLGGAANTIERSLNEWQVEAHLMLLWVLNAQVTG